MRNAAFTIAIASVIAVTACSGPDAADDLASQATTATAAAAGGFEVSSADFDNMGRLPGTAKANAFGGQCTGDNVSPELAWTGAPADTAGYAITMLDLTSGNYVHWIKADIPADVTAVTSGGADALAGTTGANSNGDSEYFGPCPPGGDHNYVFTVYALDAPLALPEGFTIGDLKKSLKEHTLAEASIVGISSPRDEQSQS